MTLPELDEHGHLPPGVHDGTLDEIRSCFGRPQSSDRRPGLQRRLEAFLAEVLGAGLGVTVLVDGSFVTGEPDPSDVDLILILPADHDWTSELRSDQYNVLSKRRVKARHRMDVLVAVEGSQGLHEYIDFFTEVRGQPGLRKGMVRLIP